MALAAEPLREFDTSHARERLLAGLLVVGLSLLPYLGALHGEFVAGDIDFISENPALREPDLWRKAFAYSYWYQGGASDPGRYYRPLVVLLDGVNLAWFGENTLGYHVVNQLLHALASLGVWWLLSLLLARAGLALWAACLFAVHPMHVHAVAYISGRTSLLCTLLVVTYVCCALMADAAGTRRAQLRWGAGASLSFACALLTKEHALIAPLLAVCAFWARSPGLAASLRRRAPWFALEFGLVLVYLLVRKLVLGHVGAAGAPAWQQLSPLAALLSMAKIVAFYPLRLLWPSGLSYLPAFTPAFDASSVSGWCALSVLVAWLVAIVTLRDRARLGCALSAWTLIALAPVSGVVPLEYFVKEHHAYLAAVGFTGLIALLVERGLHALPEIRTSVLRVAAGAVVCSLVALAQLHAAHFQNVRALYERIVELEPGIDDADFARPVMRGAAERFGVTHLNLGLLELKANAFEPAHAHFERAQRLARSKGLRFQTRFLSADSLLGLGDLAGAERAFSALSADDPKHSEPESKLAQIAARRGRKDDMLAHLKLACARGGREACAQAARFEH